MWTTEALTKEIKEGFETLDEQGLVVPHHLRGGIIRYVVNRVRPGQFVSAVLENDLVEAIVRAKGLTFDDIHAVVKLLLNFTPAPCWGSKAKVAEWLKGRDASHDSKPTSSDGDHGADSTESRDTAE